MPVARKKPAAPKRKPAARKTTKRPTVRKKAVIGPPNDELKPPVVTEEERQALLTSYSSLKSAGLQVPKEISDRVEVWIAEEQERRDIEAVERAQYQAVLDEENATGPWYIRNGYSGAPLSLRLDRQTEKRRIELKPRGVPGDMHPLEDKDLNDPVLRRNVQNGVCEVIPAGEANRIAERQTTNMAPRVHTPTAILRRADGKPYEGNPVKTEIEYNAQGITVGVINPDQIQGGVEDKAVARDGGVQRVNPGQREVASQFIPTGGNPHIIQSGPPPSPGEVPGLDPARAKIADDLARRKGIQGPQAGLSGMQVTVEPVRKS
jgi:hypothetical protein